MIATDVAARGIDVQELTHVLHHKLPDQLEIYTHRSGRTGRAGNKGISLALINSREGRKIKELENKLQIKFEQMQVPEAEELKDVEIRRWMKNWLSLPVEKEAETVWEEIKGHFDGYTREELVKKLLTKELKRIYRADSRSLNTREEKGRGRDKERSSGKSKNKDKSSVYTDPNQPQRYFINLGTRDGLNKHDFNLFIADVANIPKKKVSNVTLMEKHAFFDIAPDSTQGFESKFEGLELEGGHQIRVNAEAGKPERERGRGGKRSGYRQGGRKRDSRKRQSGNRKRKS